MTWNLRHGEKNSENSWFPNNEIKNWCKGMIKWFIFVYFFIETKEELSAKSMNYLWIFLKVDDSINFFKRSFSIFFN